MSNSASKRRRSGESGSSLIEFVLCFSLFWVPFFMGLLEMGTNLIRNIQVTEVCRDAAHMLAYGIDFSDPNNQAILLKVAQGLNVSSSGTGVINLSVITYIGSTDCTAAGLQANTSSCPNINQVVFTNRLVIGNPSVRTSGFLSTPNSCTTDSQGDIAATTYLKNTTCRANGFSNLMTLVSGQYAYVGEMTVNSPDYSSWAPLGQTSSSARSIF